MTRRILLTLADNTTATECGACRSIVDIRNDEVCGAFARRLRAGRLPECIAAEAAAARMVEIAPKDAAMFLDYDRERDAPHEFTDVAYRVYEALDAHGKRVRP